MTAAEPTPVEWKHPDPGTWQLDRSHLAFPATPLAQHVFTVAGEKAYAQIFAELGVPAEKLAFRFVNGYLYTQMVPLIGSDKPPSRLPPTWLLKVIFRLQPELRRREKKARATIANPEWQRVIATWPLRATEIQDLNLAIQATAPRELDDNELASHTAQVLAHVEEMYFEHHVLHAADLGPLGLLVSECQDWGIGAADTLKALIGASPETSEPVKAAVKIRQLIEEHLAQGGPNATERPSTLAQARSLSPEILDHINRYLERHGWTLYSGYDLGDRALAEDPEVVLHTILTAETPKVNTTVEQAVGALREKVPLESSARFDELIEDARKAMHMRDAQGPLTLQWPWGLLRRALLEAGRRAHESHRLDDPHDIFELGPTELEPFIGDHRGPTAQDLADRRTRRFELRSETPPKRLGPPAPAPPLAALPIGMRTLTKATLAAVDALGMANDGASRSKMGELDGTGIGDRAYVGTAVVAHDAGEAMSRLEPGDVLVTFATSPSFNLVLGSCGALVTASGGPMSHAAVLARELGLPAVIGVDGAMRLIKDGDRITVDPLAGQVSVIKPSS